MSRAYPNRLIGSMQVTSELLRMRLSSLEHKQKRALEREGADSATVKRLAVKIARDRATLDRVSKRFSRIEERLDETPMEQPPPADERTEAAIRGFRDFVARVAETAPRPTRERVHIAPPPAAVHVDLRPPVPKPSVPSAPEPSPSPAPKPPAPKPSAPPAKAAAPSATSAASAKTPGKEAVDKKKKKKH